uniref:F-box domain-containing protein n=1 Tax=Acrobeloides nanus TaxID=290746 RepID=A0A914ECU6_9BILA
MRKASKSYQKLKLSKLKGRPVPDVFCDVLKCLEKKEVAKCELVCRWWNNDISKYQDILPLKRIYLLSFYKGEFHFTNSDVKEIYLASKYFTIFAEYYFIFRQCYFERFEFPWHPEDLRETVEKLNIVHRNIGKTISIGCFSHFIYFKTLSSVSYSSYLKSLKIIAMRKAEIGINWTRRNGLKKFIKDMPKKIDIHFYRDASESTAEPSSQDLIKFIETIEIYNKEISLFFHVQKPQKFYRKSANLDLDSIISEVASYLKDRPGVKITKMDPPNNAGYAKEYIIEKDNFDFKK